MFRIYTVNKEFIETKELKNPFLFYLNNIYDERKELYLKDENQYVVQNFHNTIEF